MLSGSRGRICAPFIAFEISESIFAQTTPAHLLHKLLDMDSPKLVDKVRKSSARAGDPLGNNITRGHRRQAESIP